MSVTTARVRQGPLERRWRISAEVQATQLAQVVAAVSGRVVEVAFEAGTQAEKGQVIARQDRALLVSARDAARAALATAKADLDEARGRVERRTAFAPGTARPLVALEEMEAAVIVLRRKEAERNRAELTAAAWRLDQTDIRAPLAGVLQRRSVDGLTSVSTSTPAMRSAAFLGLPAVASSGLDMHFKANTVKTRTHSLFRQGCMYHSALPTMYDKWVVSRLKMFKQILAEHSLVENVFFHI